MAQANSIPPFPADLDRNSFGHWLSGFTDGEGCFCLTLAAPRPGTNANPVAFYAITLRLDDLPILRLVQSYLGCGSLTLRPTKGASQPSAEFRVLKVADLVTKVIPHFDLYPLRAKKAEDYQVWKQGVLHVQSVRTTRITHRPGHRTGNLPRWTPERLAPYVVLRDALRQTRRFEKT